MLSPLKGAGRSINAMHDYIVNKLFIKAVDSAIPMRSESRYFITYIKHRKECKKCL